jgi:hypothetical protein
MTLDTLKEKNPELNEKLLDSERIGQDKRLEGKKKSLMTNNQACKIICLLEYTD